MSDGRTAYEQQIDAFLERIEGQLSKMDDALAYSRTSAENSAVALAAVQSLTREFADLRAEVRAYNGKFSNLQAASDATLAIVRDIRAGFEFLRVLPREPAPEHIAEIVALRGPEQPR